MGLVHLPAGERTPLELADRLLHLGRAHVCGLDDDTREDLASWERLLESGCMSGWPGGTAKSGVAPCAQLQRGHGERQQEAPPIERTAEITGLRKDRSDDPSQIRPSPSSRRSRLTKGTRPRSTRSPSQEEVAGRRRWRPEHGYRDDEDRAQCEGRHALDACENIPDMATMTVSPEISTDRPDVAAGRFERRLLAAPGGALLAFALQVEHR